MKRNNWLQHDLGEQNGMEPSNIINGSFILNERSSPEAQLHMRMREEGLDPPENLVLDGRFHRFPTNGKKDDNAGWYIVYGDGVSAGKFGDWRSGEEYSFRANVGRQLNRTETLAVNKRMEEAKQARDAELKDKYKGVAVKVQEIWKNCQEASPEHPYLVRKGVESHGIRMTKDNRLVLPLYNSEGVMTTVQYISKEGKKKYHPGGQAGGSGWWLGNLEGATKVYIAEGFATAATIFEETGRPVVIAYSAGNLMAMGKMFRGQLPRTSITFVADNDNPNPKTGENTGVAKAQKAAESIGANVVYPPEIGTDANDYRANGGNLKELLGECRKRMVFADELSVESAPIRWLVKDWIQENALVMVHGPSGSGKSFVVIDWMCSIASGIGSWIGLPVKQGDVIYLCGEGHYGLRARLKAWKIAHKKESIGPLAISNNPSDLDNQGELSHVVQDIVDTGVKPKLIVIDTLNRFMSGDENSAQDTRTFLDACSTLMYEFDCTVLIVHHTGLNQDAQGRARGSSAWKGALDMEISVKSEGQRKLSLLQVKNKDGEPQEPIQLELESVILPDWLDEEGKPASSAVVIEDLLPREQNSSQTQEDIHEMIEVWEETGKLMMDGKPIINRAAWRDYLINKKCKSVNAARQTLKVTSKLIISRLVKEHIIEVDDSCFKVVDQPCINRMKVRNRE